MRWQELARETCSVARTLSVIGDRWTILILRECFRGVSRFDDFLRRLEIPRRVLAARLKKLVDKGVLRRQPYQPHARRFDYLLTDKGRDLQAVILVLLAWGDRHMAPDGPPLLVRHDGCGAVFTPTLSCSACDRPIRPGSVTTERGPGAAPRTEVREAAS